MEANEILETYPETAKELEHMYISKMEVDMKSMDMIDNEQIKAIWEDYNENGLPQYVQESYINYNSDVIFEYFDSKNEIITIHYNPEEGMFGYYHNGKPIESFPTRPEATKEGLIYIIKYNEENLLN